MHNTLCSDCAHCTDVGFHVGQRSEINYLVLQAHYATPLQDKDSSGVNLLYTLNPLVPTRLQAPFV